MDPLTQRLFHIGGGRTPTGYWISEITGVQNSSNSGVAVGASGSVYGCSTTQSLQQYIYKLNQDGLLIWQRTYSGSSQNAAAKIAVTSAEDVFVCGYNLGTIDGANFASTIVKYSSSGTLQYQRSLNLASIIDVAEAIVVDSVGAFVVSGYVNNGSDQRVHISLFDSAGSSVWRREILGSRAYSGLSGIPGGDIYFSGATNATLSDALIGKINSSGLTTWLRKHGSPANGDFVSDIAVGQITVVPGGLDIPAPAYIVGSTGIVRPGLSDIFVTKYNSDGTVAWERALSGASGANTGTAIAVAQNNAPVAVGQFNGKILIAKYDESGNLLWQRLLGSSDGTLVPVDVAVTISGIYMSARFSGTNKLVTCKLRADGSGIGASGSYTYEAGDAVNSSISLGSTSLSLTNQASSIAAGTPTLTSAEATLSQTALIIT